MASIGSPLPVTENLPGWIVAGVVASIALLLHRLSTGPQISHFPLLGKEYGSRRKRIEAFLFRPVEVYQNGYQKFKDEIYRITMPDTDHLIVPARYLDELRTLPDSDIDVLKSFQHIFANEHIKLFPPKDRTEVANSVVKVELTRSLARLNPRLSAEVDQTVQEVFPHCEDWTQLPIFLSLLRVVAIVSGNLFVGPEVCRNEEYLNVAIGFTNDITAGAADIKRWPAFLRGLVVKFNLEPSVQRSYEHRAKMTAILKPMVEERRRLAQEGKEVPDDVLQWMIEKTTENGISNLDHLVQMQLLITLASIHTTSLAVTAMMYDLASRPELVQDLRKEITTVLKETDGVMTSLALFNMKLLDSFMRESQRFTPPFVDSFRRYVQKPITLKDGTHLPAGTYIETPSVPVLFDSKYYEDPEKFDAYRFYNIRTNPDAPDPNNFKNREQYQFVSVTKENMSFGFGKHACPGRFFAANEIKLILARLLLRYDVRFPADVKERYPNFYMGSLSGPSPIGIVELKSVQS